MTSPHFPPHRLVLWSCAVASTLTVGLGDFSLGLHVPLLLASAAWLLLKRGLRMRRHVTIMGVLCLSVLFHFLVTQITTPCTDMFVKSFVSLSLLMLVVVALQQLALRSAPEVPIADIKVILAFVILALLIDAARVGFVGDSALLRASGIFAEPSHLAMSMAPLVVALSHSDHAADRYWGWASFVIMTILSASATLFMMVALCFAVSLLANSRRRFSLSLLLRVFAGMAVVGGVLVVSPFRDEIMNRVIDIAEIDSSANLSSVVYVNGWESASQNLSRTHGLGLGFNRMGCSPRPQTESGEVLDFLGLSDQNYNDGSFPAAKLLSELGVLGLAIWLIMVGALFRMIQQGTKWRVAGASPHFVALVVSALTVITLGALFRGMNYFSGPYIFGLYSLMVGLANVRRTSTAWVSLPLSSKRRLHDHSGTGGATPI